MATLPVPGPDGVIRVSVDDLTRAERSMLGSYYNAVQRVLGGQDPHAAAEFEGVEIAGLQLPTDPDVIEDLDDQRAWDIDDFYSSDEPTTGS
jgi:hypothetical protein